MMMLLFFLIKWLAAILHIYAQYFQSDYTTTWYNMTMNTLTEAESWSG